MSETRSGSLPDFFVEYIDANGQHIKKEIKKLIIRNDSRERGVYPLKCLREVKSTCIFRKFSENKLQWHYSFCVCLGKEEVHKYVQYEVTMTVRADSKSRKSTKMA